MDWRLTSGELRPLLAEDAAPATAGSRARLVDMTYERLVFGVSAVACVGLPFVAWLWVVQVPWWPFALWTAAYFAAALAMRRHRRRYARLRAAESDEAALARWIPVVHRLALAHGAGLAAAVAIVVTVGQAPFDFTILLHISIATILALNATHQTPVLGAFQRFFFVCWGTCLALMPWSFPQHWHYVLPLALLYAVSLYRHARVAHRFFLHQARLEDEATRLAERWRLAKDEAEAALQAKNDFLATASHDLRQPVHAMGFLVESIAHRNRDAALQPPLDDLRRSVRAVHFMFNSLLDLSRIERGVLAVQRAPVALAPLLREVAHLFGGEAASRGLQLRVRADPTAVVQADPVLLRQCVVNLAHNALRYTEAGGVLLTARRRGSGWQLEVWDTGMGVADDERPHIYSPWYRPELAWRADSAGHGLGLAVVARCAGLMGATHGLASVPGRGSRFWLRLAGADADAAAPWSQPPGEAFQATGTLPALSGRCLVLEDDPEVTAGWRALMQAWGVELRCAANGREAFAWLDAGFVPRAILCDQRLRSGESGFELLQALMARCPDARGAMVSGEYASPALQDAQREGYLVLFKPLDVAQLHALLAQWML